MIGVNSRLDTLQAAILDVKLRYLESWNKARAAAAGYYDAALKDIDRLRAAQTDEAIDPHIPYLHSENRPGRQGRLREFPAGPSYSNHGILSCAHASSEGIQALTDTGKAISLCRRAVPFGAVHSHAYRASGKST
jgi:hypothetical protein